MRKRKSIEQKWRERLTKHEELYATYREDMEDLQARVERYYNERGKSVHAVLFYGFGVDAQLMFRVTVVDQPPQYVSFDTRDLALNVN